MAAKVTFPKPIDVVTVPQQRAEITTMTVSRYYEDGDAKILRGYVKELKQMVTIWAGADFTAAGQWTDADVEARLQAMYGVK